MKKTIALTLAALMLLLTLVSCDSITAEGEPNNGLDNSADQNNGSNNESEDRSIEVIDSNSDLVIKLIEYCNFLINPPSWELPELTLEDQINTIKQSGAVKPLLVDYQAWNCYYICAYYNCDEHDPELREYYCASEYTWVKYGSVKDLSDNYDDKAFVLAFQINRPTITKNILTGDDSQRMEIISQYTPTFVDGKNMGDIDAIERSFIFLTSANDSIIYRVPTSPHSLYEINCIRLENKYYICLEIYTVSTGGERYDYDHSWNLGEYYDSMMDIMITGKYSKELSNGSVRHYGLFDINEFSDKILGEN